MFAGSVGWRARLLLPAEHLAAGADKVNILRGPPIPSSVLLVVILGVAGVSERLGERLYLGEAQWLGITLHPFVLLFALSGSP